MTCDDCGKEKTVHVKIFVNGEDHEKAWGQSEAALAGFHSPFDPAPFPLAGIIASILGKNLPVKYDAENNPRCPHCGLSFMELLEVGRIGCAHCYTAFGRNMEILLEKIHGTSVHSGTDGTAKPIINERPARRLSKKDRLKLELKKAIEIEDYESAARLRDRLKALEAASK